AWLLQSRCYAPAHLSPLSGDWLSRERMSDFVNYDKRDINLPPGCKNLIDVLQPMVPPPGLKPRRGLTMGGGETATISSIPKYINNFLNQSNQDLLLIRTPNEK